MKAKRNARVAAVQVIFQYYFSRSNIKKIIYDYQTLNDDLYEEKLSKFDENKQTYPSQSHIMLIVI